VFLSLYVRTDVLMYWSIQLHSCKSVCLINLLTYLPFTHESLA